MVIRKRHLTAAAALLLATPGASGAAEATPETGPARLDFATLKIGREEFEGIRYAPSPEAASEPLDFRLVQRSGPYPYRGPREIVFFRERPAATPEAPDAVERTPVARTTVPREWRRALFFFDRIEGEADRKNRLPYRVHAMDDSLEAFPRESVVAFNATGRTLHGRLGDRRLKLPPGPSEAIPFGAADGGLPAGFAVKTPDGPRVVFEHRLDFSGAYRIILMLAPPRREQSIRISVYHIPQYIGRAAPP